MTPTPTDTPPDAAALAPAEKLREALKTIAARARWPSGAKRGDLAGILTGIEREARMALAATAPVQRPLRETADSDGANGRCPSCGCEPSTLHEGDCAVRELSIGVARGRGEVAP